MVSIPTMASRLSRDPRCHSLSIAKKTALRAMLRNWISCSIVELQDLRGHKGLRVCKGHRVLRVRLDL